MDKDLFYISLFLLFIGIGGQLVWYFFGIVPHTVASFQELQNVTSYAMMIGLILLPAGLFKDGLPSPGYGAKVFIGVLLVLVVGITFTGLVLMPGASSAAPKANAFVSIANGASNPGSPRTFVPDTIVVFLSGPNQNNTVQWTNNDVSPHTVTSTASPPAFNSGIINPGATFTYTFTQPGTYPYICTLHPTWMNGTVIVESG